MLHKKNDYTSNVFFFYVQQLVESNLQYANIAFYSAKLVLILTDFLKINFIKNRYFLQIISLTITTLFYVLGCI